MRGRKPIEVFPFEPSFADELVLMWRASFEQGVGVVDPHPIAEQREYLMTQVLPANEVRVALHGQRIVGFAAASLDTLARLYMHSEYQGCGIGTRLLDWAKGQSDGKLLLFTFARNHRARAFYRARGFVEVSQGFEPNWKLDDVKFEWSAAGGVGSAESAQKAI